MTLVLILLIAAVAANRFIIQPLNRLISTTYYPVSYEEIPEESVTVETPEVYELMYILAYLGGYGGLGVRSEAYLEDVQQWFSGMEHHRAVSMIREFFSRGSLYDLGFSFALGIDDGSLYSRGNYSVEEIFEARSLAFETIENFIEESRYEEFYQKHHDFYHQMHAQFLGIVPLDDVRQWLEQHFSARHDLYRVLISPMASSKQYAYLFRDWWRRVHEIIVALPPVHPQLIGEHEQDRITYEEMEALASLEAFTELAYGYAGPATDGFINRAGIQEVFSHEVTWFTGVGYGLPTQVFNEYLVWTAYILYCEDRYSPKTVEMIHSAVSEIMKRRGFVIFDEFALEVLDLRRNHGDDFSLEKSYSDMLAAARRISTEENQP